MIILVLLAMLIGMFVLAGKGFFWTMHQAGQAAKYRKLMEELAKSKNTGTSNSWSVKYKMGNVVREMTVQGDTEEKALMDYIKKGGSPRGVLSVTRL